MPDGILLEHMIEEFTFEVLIDPVLNRPPGPESVDQSARYEAVTKWLERRCAGGY